MGKKRRRFSNEFKAKVAMDAVRGVHTLSELSTKYDVHPTLIAGWKRQLVGEAASVFETGQGGSRKSDEEITAPLYQEIGKLKMEVDFLRKKL